MKTDTKKRLLITIDPTLLDILDHAANSLGMTRSGMVEFMIKMLSFMNDRADTPELKNLVVESMTKALERNIKASLRNSRKT